MIISMRNLSIKAKLIVMMTITTGISMLFMAIIISINAVLVKHDSILTELSTLAEVIGSQSTGAIEFDDPNTAREHLNALSVKKNIIYAAIWLENGQIFAVYVPHANSYNGLQAPPNMFIKLLQQLSMGKLADTIKISKTIYFEGQSIGEIQIVSSLMPFYLHLINYFSRVSIIVLTCFILGLAVSARLHRLISSPIIKLNRATKKVSKDNAYWVRIPNHRNDELGNLIDSFNHMLEQIEMRNQQLADYSNQLEAQVEERTVELIQVNERRIQWLENMAGVLKHELKNSTVGIKSSLELIERRAQECSIDVYLNRAKKSLHYMAILLDSISNASSIEATVYKESLSPLNLTSFIKSQADEYRSYYPQYKLIDQCAPNITILGNENRLKQLLDKLVSNAFEHCYSNSPVLINVLKKDGWVELSIINEGISLPADKECIFDLFISLRDSEHKKSDSLGLGLYLVQLIAESHGGSVKAIDRKDKEGAIFTVKIPLIKKSNATV